MADNVDKIYETLKREIINLDLIPGTKVREEDLATRFSISRTPIRSVIARLCRDELLEVIPQKGTYVTKINTSNVDDLIYIRKSIEKTVIQELCSTVTSQQIDELREILEEQKRIIDLPGSVERSKIFFHNDNLFHKTIFSFCDKIGVWRIIHTNATNLNRVRIISNLRQQNEVEKVYDQHVKMLQCLENKDSKTAIEIFDNHIDGGFEGINAVKEKYSEYFI